KSSICLQELLHTFSCSKRGIPAAQYLTEANAAQYSIIPRISYFGILAVTVTEDNVKSNLCQNQALVNNPNPLWTIQVTFHNVVSTTFLCEWYHHSGYDCPLCAMSSLFCIQIIFKRGNGNICAKSCSFNR
ncbi:hypothetical protein VP01_4133g4, partial [Puccinia sorghi]